MPCLYFPTWEHYTSHPKRSSDEIRAVSATFRATLVEVSSKASKLKKIELV